MNSQIRASFVAAAFAVLLMLFASTPSATAQWYHCDANGCTPISPSDMPSPSQPVASSAPAVSTSTPPPATPTPAPPPASEVSASATQASAPTKEGKQGGGESMFRKEGLEIHGYGAAMFDIFGAQAIAATEDFTPFFLNEANENIVDYGHSGQEKILPSVGVGGSLTFFKNILGAYADYSYILSDKRGVSSPTPTLPTGNCTLAGTTMPVTCSDFYDYSTQSETEKRGYQMFQAGLQASLGRYRAVPYFQFGGGFLHEYQFGTFNDYETLGSAFIGGPLTNSLTCSGTAGIDYHTISLSGPCGPFTGTPASKTKNNPMLHAGFGLRYALRSGEHYAFGIRTGVDGYYLKDAIFNLIPAAETIGADLGSSALSQSRHGFARATFGFYYQFR